MECAEGGGGGFSNGSVLIVKYMEQFIKTFLGLLCYV